MTQPLAPPEQPPAGTAVALIAAAEAAFAASLLAAYAAWLAQVSQAVLAAFVRFGLPPDPTAIYGHIPAWERHVDRLLPDLMRMARIGWEAAARDLGLDAPFDPSDPILLDQLQRTRNLMVRTPDEVYRLVLRELDATAGQPPAVQAEAVRRVLDVSGVENWPARAQTVAVTEVNRVFGFGGLALASRYAAFKTWDAKEDSSVRPEHREADGQRVPVSQPFLVGGFPLRAPGDPDGPPHLVINCRCRPRYNWSAT